jgi:hypothetical protein
LLARRWLGEFAVALVKGLPVAELLFFALRTLSTAPDYHISPWPSTMWPNQRLSGPVASGAPLAATRPLKRPV